MELTAPLDEVVVLLRAADVLPPAVTDVRSEAGAVMAKARVDELPGVLGAVRAMARFAPAADVRIDDLGVSGRTWTLSVQVALPMLPMDVSGFVAEAVRTRLAKAPGNLATVRADAGRTLIGVDLDALAALLPMLPAAGGVRARVDEVSLGARVRLAATVTGR